MDLIGCLLPSSDENEQLFTRKNLWISILFLAFFIPTIFFCLYFMATTSIMNIGRIKFSMEPIGCTGLDFTQAGAPVPPTFNVTLHAKSTYSWSKFCSSGQPPAMEVIYSGVTIAKTDMEPFCIDVKGEKVIIATAISPGWLALPKAFQERMESDRRHGGVQMEVDFIFSNKDPSGEETTWWVRCPTKLDAHKGSPCISYFVRGYYE